MKVKILSLFALTMMLVGSLALIPSIPVTVGQEMTTVPEVPVDVLDAVQKAIAEDNPSFPSDFNIDDLLGDRDNNYQTIYEPWKSKAAIHSIAYDTETGFLACGGGYLYDNEVHLFRMNVETNEFDKVFELGDGIIRSDVLSVDFGDTDLNDFLEVIVGSADGHVYVFEQRHLYDPYANTENMFDLVWTSPGLFKVFSVKVDDVDRDYRPDIIVGSWDGFVHLYEYDNHSAYPFEEAHWITYREVAKLDVGEKIYSLETGDTNNNGLPEIIVGTRDGTVFVFENDGISLMINGQPFPLIRDNSYYLNWTSLRYTWEPIRSMAVGELDGSPGDEIALVAEGQGVFTLNWNSATKSYDYNKVQREFAAWETFGLHGLDYWVDRIVSAKDVIYQDPVNSTLVIEEPISYVWNEGLGIFLPDASVYPYNTGMAQATDGNYSLFDASGGFDNVSAIVDWGNDEEGTGGANPDADIIMTFEDPIGTILDMLNFSVGQSTGDFEQISPDRMSINPYNSRQLLIDVDDAMSEREWNWFRYAKIVVYNGGNYSINSLELVQVYNLLTDVLSVTIGPFDFDGNNYWTGDSELDKIVAGTSVGEFICIGYNGDGYDVLWESYDDDRYKLDAYVWDIEFIDTMPNVANYVKMFDLDLVPGVLGYNSWSYGVPAPLLPDPDFGGVYQGGDGEPIYLVGTDGYFTLGFDMNGDDSTLPFGAVNGDIIKPYTAAEMAWLWPEYGFYPTIISTTYDPNAPYFAESLLHGKATMDFYTRAGPTDPYYKLGSIQSFDATGQITQLLYSSKTTPRLSFKDYDADGDLDMIISNGYVYMCRNMLEEEGEPMFMLEPSYLADINEQTGSIVWGQPEWFDIDADGNLDLILSYGTKYGVTVFLNKGTNLDPVWVEDKLLLKNANPLTAMTTLELKDARMIPNTGGSTLQKYAEAAEFDLQGDYHMGVYDPAAKQLTLAMATYDSMESYLVATYPTVSRMEFCIKYSESFKNLGFHIHESWNTDFDLNDWTMSISSGDLDGDGRGEIIVGDYDNNVYAFEHLTNNTYKRMFRSFDLNHTVVSDESPYAYEDLEGISGDFNRRIFDHATHLMTGTDLDQDGFLELIVVSDLQVYFFEATGIDDTLSLAYTFDLRDLGYMDVEFDIWEDLEQITALDAGSDLDSDGRKELVLAAGGFIFVYNVEVDSFEGMENTDFFSSSSDKSGRYYLIGNPQAAGSLEYAQINTLVTGDTDQDGHPEIIVGGIVDSRLLKSDGFAFIYECRGGTFYKAWNTSEDRSHWNPVSTIMIADQDYDGLDEIIIGHSYGIDIYEWLPGTDSQYQLTESITSSPNYPAITTNSVINQLFETFTVSNRSTSDLTWTADGSLAIYVYTDGGVLKYRAFDPDYNDFDHPVPFGAQIYTGAEYGGGSSIDYEMEPSVIGTSEGFYMTWRTQRLDGQFDIWVSLYNFSRTVPDWEDPVAFFANSYSTRILPKIFEYNSTHIGIMYTQKFIAGQDQLRYHLLEKGLDGGWSSWITNYHVDFPRYTDYDILAGSIAKLDDGRFAIAFSARDTAYGKSDYDIWTVIANESMYFADQIIHQATTSFYDETYPDIEYLRSDNQTILVAYEVRGVAFDERIGIVSSSDNGSSWSMQQNLNPYPNYLTRIDYPGGYFQYYDGTTRMFRPEAYSPTILGLYDGGFVYTLAFTSVDESFTDVHDIIFGIERETDWAYNHLGGVAHMATGDTDSDARQEIIVSFGEQFAVYEIKQSTDGTGLMTYEEVYLSGEFVTEITGITVYDSNINGWQEIAISCRYGDVFVLEYSDPSHGATQFGFSEQVSELATYGMAYPFGVKAVDIDDDGKDELLLAPGAGGFHMFDDDGTLLYNVSYFTFLLGSTVVDLDGDGIPELVSEDGNEHIIAFDLTDGSIRWNYSSFTDGIECFDVGDLDGDGTFEVVVATDDSKIWTLNHTGVLWHTENVDPGDIWCIAIGDYNDDPLLGVAYGNDTYAVKVINPINGTLYYETPNGMVLPSSPQPMESHDFNGDGYDDVIFGNTVVRMADVMTGTIFFNSSVIGRQRVMLIEDFDGDNTDELFVLTKESGAYLIEIGTLRMQWHYEANLGEYQFAVAGVLGGTGAMDILLSLNNSLAIALDGKSGLPMWMNSTGRWLQGLVTADFDGDGKDAAFLWQWPDSSYYSYLKEFKAIGLPSSTWEVVFPAHPAYWKVDVGYSAFQDVWTCDIDGDNWAEVFAKTNDGYLSMWNSRYGTMTWNISLHGTIQDMTFGDLDGKGSLDAAVIIDGDTVQLFDIETTNKLGTISAPSGYRIPELAIADFRSGIGYETEELAVLYESVINVKSYVSWYDSSGTWMYTNSINSTNGQAHMAIGRFTGAKTYDVAMGSKEGTVRFFSGDDGVFDWSYAIGFYIEDIVFGDFTGNSDNQGVAVEYSDHVVLLDTFTQSPMVTLNFTFGYLRDYYCADLDGDGFDEVIAYIRTDGIRGYNTTGDEVWAFEAPLRYTLDDPFTDVLIEDINVDGYPDVVLVNYEYVDVVDGSSGDLLWHYISEGRVLGVAAAIMPFKFHVRYNLAVIDSSSLSIASYYESPPSPPVLLLLTEALSLNLTELLVISSITIIPLLVAIVVLTRYVRKEE